MVVRVDDPAVRIDRGLLDLVEPGDIDRLDGWHDFIPSLTPGNPTTLPIG
jgi:hypothetical protein